MNAHYYFQCRKTGERTSFILRDTDTLTIEEQAALHSKFYNSEIVDYKYFS